MKSLLPAGLLLSVVTCLHAQTTNTATTAPAATSAKPAATAAAADSAKTESTNQPAKPAEPYPVTAVIVSNTITFPILLSKTSEPLMTNAVFHRTFGRKVIFGDADFAVKSFDIDKLHPSVIAQLNLDPDKVKADQETLDKDKQAWNAQYQQQNQALLANAAAAMKKQAEAAQAAQAAATNGAPSTPPSGKHSRRNQPGNTQNPPPPPAN